MSARAPDCCERVSSVTGAAVATTHDVKANIVLAGLVAILPEHRPLEQSSQVVELLTALARAPPAIGPPAFIAHCRFLI